MNNNRLLYNGNRSQQKAFLMRPPPQIKPHMSIEKMFHWLQTAPDQDAYKRRMALWLAHTGNLHAHKIAQVLGVSKQAVWLWIGQYNRLGPAGLDRTGRGGRRWAFLSRWQEANLLKPFLKDVQEGKRPKTTEIKNKVEKLLGRPVSNAYIYRMLTRNNYQQQIAQSRSVLDNTQEKDTFRSISQPWQK